MTMSGVFGIGTSALQAFQRALDTTAQNIANVNTEGYSRQQVQFASRTPQPAAYGFIGKGVQATGIERIYDGFVESQLRGYTSSSSEMAVFHDHASKIDQVLADPDTGLSMALQRFANAFQDLSSDPASTSARQVVLNEAEALADRFHSLNGWLEGINDQVNDELEAAVADANQLTRGIADLNEKIVLARGMAGGQPPNDLLDQRDKLIRELSGIFSITTLEQENGAVNVMAGTGQALVVGNRASELSTYRAEGVHMPLKIALNAGDNGSVPITDQLSGGKVGGLIGFRQRMLDPALNDLGRIALGLGQLVNQQQMRGMDLNGELGQSMFTLGQPSWDAYPGVASSLTLGWDDLGKVTGADYKLQFSGGSWTLSRADTGEVVPMTGSGTSGDPFIADGMRIEVDPAAVDGDTFILQPVRSAADAIQARITDPALIAAASPVLAAAASGNTGTANITSGEVTDIDNPTFQTTPGSLSPPLRVRFTSATSYEVLDNTNPAAPVLLETVSGYDPVGGSDLFPTPVGLDPGYRVRISGAAAAGDEFIIDYNSGGAGDNRNALALAGVFDEDLLGGGTESVNDAYRRLVAETGASTRQAELAGNVQQRMLDRTLAEREAVSGVNLDEEAANLVRYQQAYQAAAQVVAVANDLFETLLNATRG